MTHKDGTVTAKISDRNKVTIVNRTNKSVKNIKVACRFHQKEILPHTMGFHQDHVPGGWFEQTIWIKELKPNEISTQRISAIHGTVDLHQFPGLMMP